MNKPEVLTNERIEQMLATCYELEGLLTLAAQRGDLTPAQVWQMISMKAKSLTGETPAVISTVHAENIKKSEPEKPESEKKKPVAAPAETPVLPFDEPQEEGDSDAEQSTIEVVETDAENMAEAAEMEQEEDADNSISAACDNNEDVHPDNQAQSASPENTSVKIQLTIGDKFRFTRELFDGKEADLKEAIGLISSMSSREEVEDYLYNDLCFDEMNPAVKEFANLVTKNF